MGWTYFLLYCYVFLFGCCVGSFVNVVALRSAEGVSFVKGRSLCPDCGATLRARDLVPLFSFLFLRGRCHFCHRQISFRYPLVEASCGVLFVFCFWQLGFHVLAANACLLAALLLCVFLLDMDTQMIPNPLVFTFLVPCLVELLLTHLTGMGIGIGERIGGFFIVSVPLLLLSYFIRDCFGGGDIKLVAVCGFLLGFRAILLAAFLAVVSCGIVSAIRLACKKVKKGDRIAFGPYLAVGIFVAKLFYSSILSAYLSLF